MAKSWQLAELAQDRVIQVSTSGHTFHPAQAIKIGYLAIGELILWMIVPTARIIPSIWKILLRYASNGSVGFTLRLKMAELEVMKGQIYLNLPFSQKQ